MSHHHDNSLLCWVIMLHHDESQRSIMLNYLDAPSLLQNHDLGVTQYSLPPPPLTDVAACCTSEVTATPPPPPLGYIAYGVNLLYEQRIDCPRGPPEMDPPIIRSYRQVCMMHHHDASGWFIMNHWLLSMMHRDEPWWSVMMNHDDSPWWCLMLHHHQSASSLCIILHHRGVW